MCLEQVANLFFDANLKAIFFKAYPHIAEVISNVYEHSVCDLKPVAQWSLIVDQSLNSLIISISDDGQGIRNSISKRLNINLSNLEALELAINQKATCAHRGQGLKNIINKVNSGDLKSLLIESGNCSLSASKDNLNYNHVPDRPGSRVQLTIEFDGESL